jgi:hypothetical protein
MQTLQQLIESLVRKTGTFGATSKVDWESGNGAATFMKTCGQLRLVFTSEFIVVTDTAGSDESISTRSGMWADDNFYGEDSLAATYEVYGHKDWWVEAQRELRVQRLEARQGPALSKLSSLLNA